ncbi:MAG TPA: ATP-binding protein [Acidimicrobiia bacterium]|nr:ATP-binding protein [Acidimicrobiia bacterium]
MTALAVVFFGCALALLVAVLVAARRLDRRVASLADAREAEPAVGEDGADAMLAQLRLDAEQLRVDGDRLTAALQAVTDGLMVVDVEGRVLVSNSAASRFTGARHSDAVAEQAISELLDQALAGQPVERELILFGPPRQTLQLRALPLPEHGAASGAVAFVRDVTESRRTENMRRDFVANVSHELRTPIGALAVLAEAIAGGSESEVTAQLAERMVRESERLARIVEDLLDLSLLEAQERSGREPLPVAALVTDAVDQVRGAADTSGISIDATRVPPDLRIECDRRQVVSAIFNLLDNAVKYSEPGQPVEVTAVRKGDRAAIVVRDHGIGIPSRDLERIFERFYRVDRARSRQTGGTGLGLAIVRHTAQAHGGEVTVESHEGEGTTFTLLLPATPPAARDLSEAS